MSIEATESTEEANFQISFPLEEESSTPWNGREVRAIDNCNQFKLAQAKMASFDIQTGRALTQTVTKPTHSLIGWNHSCFPTPKTKPILTPVPDGKTCLKCAIGLRDWLVNWMNKNFVRKGLIDRNDYLQIESILRMLVDEVENYTLAAGLYNNSVNWKEVLHPLNRLYQFWKNKWEVYGFPPSPQDYPLP